MDPKAALKFVNDNLQTSIETSHPHVMYKCERIVKTLELVAVLLMDNAFADDLINAIPAKLCAHLAEFQMISNPLAQFGGVRIPVESDWRYVL